MFKKSKKQSTDNRTRSNNRSSIGNVNLSHNRNSPTSLPSSSSNKQDYLTYKLRSGPYGNGSPRNDIPILEDEDEEEMEQNTSRPILPSFNANEFNMSTNSSLSELAKFDKKRLQEQIDDDDESHDSGYELPININFTNKRSDNDPTKSRLSIRQDQESVRADSASSSDESTDEETESSNNKNVQSTESGDTHEDTQPETFTERLKRRFTLSRPNANMEGISSMGSVSSHESHNVIAKIFGLGNGGMSSSGGGGLIPGGTSNEENQRPMDEEEKIENDIPMNFINPEDFKDEARGIVHQHIPSMNDASSSTTLVPGNNHSINSDNFFLNNPDPILDNFDEVRDGFDDDFELDEDSLDAPKPRKVKTGIASSLLALYNPMLNQSTISSFVPSGTQTPTSSSSLNQIMDPVALENKLKNINLGSTILDDDDDNTITGGSQIKKSQSADNLARKGFKSHNRNVSTQSFTNMFKNDTKPSPKDKVKYNLPQFSKKAEDREDKTYKKKRFRRQKYAARITVHIADVLQRQVFILKLCKAFMLYGAPTHRLEEYMSMTARVLEIDGSFIYFPGSMIVSFGDPATRTTDMKLVRCAQGVDLGKLDDCYEVYKDVVHDRVGVEEASTRLDEIMNRQKIYNAYACVLIYGVASAMVTPWGFGGSWIDMPISFGIGLLVGILQFIVCPKSSLYTSVFEVSASILVSFVGRALGSINGGNTFCFASIVQGSLALILPGYIILCGSLELQSRNIVAGAVRMFYAIIYSLFLGFGITLGAALYGWIDSEATSETTCTSNVSPWFRFILVPMFTVCLALINQAKYTQLPVMIIISGGGYVVSYFSSLHFTSSTEFTATLGCFMIGLLSNLYSRLFKMVTGINATGMAVSSMLPAIFVQVPSGIASQGSLLSGVTSANQIVNGTATTSTSSSGTLSFGIIMVEVALGISVGLYAATIVVYPFGKKATGIFSL